MSKASARREFEELQRSARAEDAETQQELDQAHSATRRITQHAAAVASATTRLRAPLPHMELLFSDWGTPVRRKGCGDGGCCGV